MSTRVKGCFQTACMTVHELHITCLTVLTAFLHTTFVSHWSVLMPNKGADISDGQVLI